MSEAAIVDQQAQISSSSNHLLDRVPADERAKIDDRLEPVVLDVGQVLYEPGDPLTHVYFLTSGMISLVAVMKSPICTGISFFAIRLSSTLTA